MPPTTRRKQMKGTQSPKSKGEVTGTRDTIEENKNAAEAPQKGDGESADQSTDDSPKNLPPETESQMMVDDTDDVNDATENPCTSVLEDLPTVSDMMADDADNAYEDPERLLNEIKSDDMTALGDKSGDASPDVTEPAIAEDNGVMEDAADPVVDEELVGEGDLEGENLDIDDMELDDECIEYDVIESSDKVSAKIQSDQASDTKSMKKGNVDTAVRWSVHVAPVTLQDFTQTQADSLSKLSEVMEYRTLRMPPLHLRKHPTATKLSMNSNGLLHLRVGNDSLVQVVKSLLKMDFHNSKITIAIRVISPSDESELAFADKQAKFIINDVKKAKEMVTSRGHPDAEGDLKHRCLYLKEVPDKIPTVLLKAVFPMALSVDRVKIKEESDHSSAILEMTSSEQADSILHIYEGLNFDGDTPVHVATSTKSIWSLQKSVAREQTAHHMRKRPAQGRGGNSSQGQPVKKQAVQTGGSDKKRGRTRIRKKPRSHQPASLKKLPSGGALKVVQQQAAKLAEMERKVALLKHQAQVNQMTIIQQQSRRYLSGFSGEGMYSSGNNRSPGSFQRTKTSRGMHSAQQNQMRKGYSKKP